MTNKYPNIKKYIDLWENGNIRIPLVIIIGGAAGSGKTTLAIKIAQEIPYINFLDTALIRSLLRYLVPKDVNPYLHGHTFELDKSKINKSISNERILIDNYSRQSSTVMGALRGFLQFQTTERQLTIVHGANILPADWAEFNKSLIIIDIFLYVEKLAQYRKMITGPTHNRELSEDNINNSVIISNYLIAEAKKYNKTILNCNVDLSDVMNLIDKEIGNFFVNNNINF
jgi:2-phosphoglycerate kinase